MEKTNKGHREAKIVVGVAGGLAAIMLAGNTYNAVTFKGDYNQHLANVAKAVPSVIKEEVVVPMYTFANQYIAKPLGLDKLDKPMHELVLKIVSSLESISQKEEELFMGKKQ